MNTFIKFLRLRKNFPLSNLKEVVSKDECMSLRFKEGSYKKYYYHDGKEIGHIYYNILNGYIGLFWLKESYRNRGLGKQILTETILEMKKNDVKEIWMSTSKNHFFWSNVWDKRFKYRESIHEKINNSCGYYLNLEGV
jgi:GNAT superfamily N-acetyltransferase